MDEITNQIKGDLTMTAENDKKFLNGVVPTHLRGIIHSTPEADKLISLRALRGPARMGRKKYKGDIK
jgi:hypothetical protein